MGPENDPLHGHAGRGQSRDSTDHPTDSAVSFYSRNIHDRVGFRHQSSEVIAATRWSVMYQLDFRIWRARHRLHQRSKRDRAYVYDGMVHSWVFHAEDHLEDQ